MNGPFLELYDEENSSWVPYCEAFGVRERTVDLLSNTHEITLYVDSAQTGMSTRKVLPSALLRQSVMRVMYDLGLQIPDTDDEATATHEILLETQKQAPVKFIHDRAGFADVDGQQVFLLNVPIGLTGPKAASRHYLQGVFTPCGTLDSWKALMAQEVLGHAPLELALATVAALLIAPSFSAYCVMQELPIHGVRL